MVDWAHNTNSLTKTLSVCLISFDLISCEAVTLGVVGVVWLFVASIITPVNGQVCTLSPAGQGGPPWSYPPTPTPQPHSSLSPPPLRSSSSFGHRNCEVHYSIFPGCLVPAGGTMGHELFPNIVQVSLPVHAAVVRVHGWTTAVQEKRWTVPWPRWLTHCGWMTDQWSKLVTL